MTRTVFCRKYQQQMEGLEIPPYPGAKGQDIFEHISKQAWQEWIKHQTTLINEKHLNLLDKSARQYLAEQMDKFLAGGEYDRAEGFVPPTK